MMSKYLKSVNPPVGKPPGPPFMHGFIVGDETYINRAQQLELDRLLNKETGDELPPKTGEREEDRPS